MARVFCCRFLYLFLVFFVVVVCWSPTAEAVPQPLLVYVSPTGNDANAGTAAKSFRTVARAQQEIRKFRESGKVGDRYVFLRGGIHELPDTVHFGYLDGGDEHYSVTYLPSTGEKVVISGGRKLTGWPKPTDETPDVTTLDLNKWFDAKVAKLDKDNKKEQDYWDKVEQHKAGVYKARKESYEAKPFPAVPPPEKPEWNFTQLLVNGIPAVSAVWPLEVPGQYYLDTENQRLSYYLRRRERPELLEVSAPVVAELFVVKGDREKEEPIQNLFFRRLTFAHRNSESPAIQWEYTENCAAIDCVVE